MSSVSHRCLIVDESISDQQLPPTDYYDDRLESGVAVKSQRILDDNTLNAGTRRNRRDVRLVLW